MLKRSNKLYSKYTGTVLWFSSYLTHNEKGTGRIAISSGTVYDFTVSDITLDTIKLTNGRLKAGDVVEFWARDDSESAVDIKLMHRSANKERRPNFFEIIFLGRKPRESLVLTERPRQYVEKA